MNERTDQDSRLNYLPILVGNDVKIPSFNLETTKILSHPHHNILTFKPYLPICPKFQNSSRQFEHNSID